MNINTKFLGEVNIDEKEIIQFSNGLPGFENVKEFIVLSLENESLFAILQSIKDPEIGFIIAVPFIFKENYEFDLLDEDKEELKVDSLENLIIYSIVTLKDPFNNSTINLQAPIIINHNTRLAKQLVLLNSDAYPLRFPIERSKA